MILRAVGAQGFMQDYIRLQRVGTWSGHLKRNNIWVGKGMVGPCGLEKAMFGDIKVRIIRRMGSGVWSREA